MNVNTAIMSLFLKGVSVLMQTTICILILMWRVLNYSCSFIVDLGINALKSFQLEWFLWSSDIEWLLGLYEFISSHLCISISYFWVCFGTCLFFEALHLPISLLKICSSSFSKVISDDTHNWSLGSICSSICKSFVRKTNSSMVSLQGWNTEWNSSIMVFSIVIELFCCYHTINCWLLVKLLKIFGIISIS